MKNDLVDDAISKLPRDWWKNIQWCASCSNLFKGYILGLMLSGEIYGQSQTILYSGFLFEFKETLIWFTAGHITDEINKVLSDKSSKNLNGRWIDWEIIPGADSIPVNFQEFHLFSGWDYGHDLGMYIMGSLEREIIVRNTHSICFSMNHVDNIQSFEPEGYYLLGFPASLTEKTKVDETQVYRSTLICLPIEKIPFSTDLGFEDPDPNAFYGKIVDFPDASDVQIKVPGMSGGPIIGVKRDSAKGIDYRLYAIQSKWLSESRIIKAEPILEPIEWLTKI